MYPVEIDGQQLRLREFTPDDVDAVHAIYGDTEVTRHLSFEPRSEDEVRGLIHRLIADARAEPRSEYSLAVVRAEDDALIGYARLATEPHRSATIGGAFRADALGLGHGTESLRLLCTLGFEHLGLHRIWAARSPDNSTAERVLRKLGFTLEARIRDHVFVHGAWRDSITYSLLEHEWTGTP